MSTVLQPTVGMVLAAEFLAKLALLLLLLASVLLVGRYCA